MKKWMLILKSFPQGEIYVVRASTRRTALSKMRLKIGNLEARQKMAAAARRTTWTASDDAIIQGEYRDLGARELAKKMSRLKKRRITRNMVISRFNTVKRRVENGTGNHNRKGS